tara:strand:- start:1700 stop:2347 length:648 start_codon:yes stop_codon:yes gene_type:complete
MVTMPLDTIKTQMQIKHHAGMFSCAQSIIGTDGVRGLYFGFRPFIIQASGKAAVRFYMFDMLCKGVDAAGVERSRHPTMWTSICGMGAGMAEALFWTAPTERLKVLRQSRAGMGDLSPHIPVSHFIREHGISTLYVGMVPTMLRQATSVATRFTLLDQVKAAVCAMLGYDTRRAPSWVVFVSGGVGGFVSAMVNNPLDVAKSRIQSGVSKVCLPS